MTRMMDSPSRSGGKRMRLLATTALAIAAMSTASPGLAQQTADEDQQQAQGQQAEEQQTIVVTGSQVTLTPEYAGGQVARGSRAGLLGNLDTMESPFSATAFTENLILDQQAESVGDVLQNEPGVQVARGFGNFQQVYFVRGFPVFSDDMTYNGVYGILPRQYVASEMLERVEIFRGANSFLNGAAPGGSGVGGAVNLVPKRAPNDPLFRATFGGGDNAQGYAGFDIGRRFGEARRIGLRVNGAARAGETAIEDQHRTLYVLAVGTDYRGPRLRFSIDIGYQNQHIEAPRPSVTPSGAAPRPPEADSNFAQPWTFADERQLFGAARGEFDITDDITIWLAAGGRNGEEANVLANPTSDPNGVASAFRFDNTREDTIFSADAGIRADVRTGPLEHRFIVSGSLFNFDAKNAFDFYFTPTPSNIFNFVPVAPPVGGFIFSGGVLSNPLKTLTTDTRSVAVADVIHAFDDMVVAVAGVRWQEIETASFDFNTGNETSRYKSDATTPAFGLVVRPTREISIYANYGESLIPGAIAPTTSGGLPVVNAGEVFPPFRAKQYEAGVKVDLHNFGGSLSAFSLALPSAFVTTNGAGQQVFSVSGEQRNRGLEFNIYGEPIDGLRLLGGITYIDAELRRNAIPATNGNTAIGVPKWQSSLNVEWDVPGGFTLEGRVTHSSRQFINAANTFSIPSYVVFDAGVRYTVRTEENVLTLRARVENVGGRNYWSQAGGFPGANYLVLGDPRSIWLSATIEM